MCEDMFGNDLTETDSFGTPVDDDKETTVIDEVLCECGEPLEAIEESRRYYQFHIHSGDNATVELKDCLDVCPLGKLEFACEDPQCNNMYDTYEVVSMAREQAKE